ncbi:MAG: GNAT family N-acetyltransferase [Candidatus Lokiarchaeota archaeon]|nr:GNAT family N-acetyltransferase [Candidatus Lokiarchaeota archaeon]
MENKIDKVESNKEKDFLNLSRLNLSPHYIEDFLKFYRKNLFKKKKQKEKISYDLAKISEAGIIIQIIKDAFKNYPFNEMLDLDTIKGFIESDKNHVFVFRNDKNNIIGTITFVLDFEAKKGYIRSFAVLRRYWGKLDITNATRSVYSHMYESYKDTIFIWYSETLTVSAKAQHIFKQCYVEPIGFFPNKDILCNKVESEILQVAYNRKVITQYRSKEVPRIIIEVMKAFVYSSLKYNLISVNIEEPNIKLALKKIQEIYQKFQIKEIKDKFGYIEVKMSFNNSKSELSFIYTPQQRNIINMNYKVSFLEELSVFLKKISFIIKEKEIRYCECYVSAYKPSHQRLFSHHGFKPRGYIPSWKYNKEKDVFEDYILFNIFYGEIQKDFQRIEEIDLVMNHFFEK